MSLDVSDFLDEDGNFDGGTVRTIKNRNNNPAGAITPETCAEWRREAVGAPNAEQFAEEVGRAAETVRRHLSGECACDHDAPPLEFDRSYRKQFSGSGGKWVVADE